MPSRKQQLPPVEEAMEKLIEIHDRNVRKELADAEKHGRKVRKPPADAEIHDSAVGKAIHDALNAVWAPLNSPLASDTPDPPPRPGFLGILGNLRATDMIVGAITGVREHKRALESAVQAGDLAAYGLLFEEEERERQLAALLQEVIAAHIGRGQIKAGTESTGRRDMGKKVRVAELEQRAERHPELEPLIRPVLERAKRDGVRERDERDGSEEVWIWITPEDVSDAMDALEREHPSWGPTRRSRRVAPAFDYDKTGRSVRDSVAKLDRDDAHKK